MEVSPDKTIVIPLFRGESPRDDTFRIRSYKLLQNDPMQWEAVGLTLWQEWDVLRTFQPGQQLTIFFPTIRIDLAPFIETMKNPENISGVLLAPNSIRSFSWGFPEGFIAP